MNNRLKIIKNRSDIGAGTRGSDTGIDALEIAAINKENDFLIVTHSLMFLHITKRSTIKLITPLPSVLILLLNNANVWQR